MKRILVAIAAFSLAAASQLAWGAKVMPELKKANTEICLKMCGSARGARAVERDLIFCGCVSDAYWDSVPQSEYNLLVQTGKSPSLEANLEKRLDVAKAACLKKAG